jgi:hypothetical protein
MVLPLILILMPSCYHFALVLPPNGRSKNRSILSQMFSAIKVWPNIEAVTDQDLMSISVDASSLRACLLCSKAIMLLCLIGVHEVGTT